GDGSYAGPVEDARNLGQTHCLERRGFFLDTGCVGCWDCRLINRTRLIDRMRAIDRTESGAPRKSRSTAMPSLDGVRIRGPSSIRAGVRAAVDVGPGRGSLSPLNGGIGMTETIQAVIVWCVFGLIAGAIARFLHPGSDPMSWLSTIVLGIVGSFLGGGIGYLLGLGMSPFKPARVSPALVSTFTPPAHPS